MPCPFTISSRSVICTTACPGATSSSRIPSHLLARSLAHMASALRDATSRAESVTAVSQGLLEHGDHVVVVAPLPHLDVAAARVERQRRVVARHEVDLEAQPPVL